MQVDTSMGSFTIELYYKHAPRTVKNFQGASTCRTAHAHACVYPGFCLCLSCSWRRLMVLLPLLPLLSCRTVPPTRRAELSRRGYYDGTKACCCVL